MPEFYSSLGITATTRILEELKRDVIPYSKAVENCGWHHSDHRTGEILDKLPYYGEVLDRHVIPGSGDVKDDEITRYGRISNPTVHIALNQLRRLINQLISVHGKPNQIVVELARELKQSKRQKQEIEKRIRENTDAAIKRSEKLNELKQEDSGSNRLLLRLYEELGPAIGPRCCPYSGKPISVKMLFDGSCDIDHILPYSRTLDDSIANQTLCLREYNRTKRNKTPWEIWGDSKQWDVILGNLKNLPENKRWRFAPDAMERFEKNNGFMDRALVDTQYLSKIARTYLDTLYTEGGHVWVVPGQMTAMLRRHWGLDSLLSDREYAKKKKDRTDHRHHAIDAAVIAATDRALLSRISSEAGKNENDGAEKVARTTDEPWVGFRNDLDTIINKLIVSHRSERSNIMSKMNTLGKDSTTGQLHNETAYGVVDNKLVVSRTPITDLTEKDITISNSGKNIRDKKLQKELSNVTDGLKGNELKNALIKFSTESREYRGIRHVRLTESMNPKSRVEISNSTGKIYKIYKGDSNHCYEIWKLPNDKLVPVIVTTFEANSNIFKKPHPAAKRMLRFHKRDLVAIEFSKNRQIYVVQKFDLNNGIYLTPHFEANSDARDRDAEDEFKFLKIGVRKAKEFKIRRVLVDEIGQMKDPGPSLL